MRRNRGPVLMETTPQLVPSPSQGYTNSPSPDPWYLTDMNWLGKSEFTPPNNNQNKLVEQNNVHNNNNIMNYTSLNHSALNSIVFDTTNLTSFCNNPPSPPEYHHQMSPGGQSMKDNSSPNKGVFLQRPPPLHVNIPSPPASSPSSSISTNSPSPYDSILPTPASSISSSSPIPYDATVPTYSPQMPMQQCKEENISGFYGGNSCSMSSSANSNQVPKCLVEIKREPVSPPPVSCCRKSNQEENMNMMTGSSLSNELVEHIQWLALEQASKDIEVACMELRISSDPLKWTNSDVKAWLKLTMDQYSLPMIPLDYFQMDGQALCRLTEEDFCQRVPQYGDTLYAQLEIWKSAANVGHNHSIKPETSINLLGFLNHWSNISSNVSNPSVAQATNEQPGGNHQLLQDSPIQDCFVPHRRLQSDTSRVPQMNTILDSVMCRPSPCSMSTSSGSMSDDEGSEDGSQTSARCPTRPTSHSHIHLWQFLKELLAHPELHGNCIRWLDRAKGVFKIEDSVRVATLWGDRKNRPAMNYDKLSRSIRQYYKKGIMKKTERCQRLVYQFCHPYAL